MHPRRVGIGDGNQQLLFSVAVHVEDGKLLIVNGSRLHDLDFHGIREEGPGKIVVDGFEGFPESFPGGRVSGGDSFFKGGSLHTGRGVLGSTGAQQEGHHCRDGGGHSLFHKCFSFHWAGSLTPPCCFKNTVDWSHGAGW